MNSVIANRSNKDLNFVPYLTHKHTFMSRGGDVCSSSFSYVSERQFPVSLYGITQLISIALPPSPHFFSDMTCVSLLSNKAALGLSS
jgi:hypothetical protein